MHRGQLSNPSLTRLVSLWGQLEDPSPSNGCRTVADGHESETSNTRMRRSRQICSGSGCKNQPPAVLCLLELEMNRWPVCFTPVAFFKLFGIPHEFRIGTNQEGGKGDPGDLVGSVSTGVLTQSDDG